MLIIDENLKKAIRDNKLVLFIGAGASTSFKLPSWKNLVLGILEKLHLDFSETSDLNFSNLKKSLENDSKTPLDILNIIENDFNNGDHYKIKAKEYVYSVFNEINTLQPLDSELHKLLWKLSSKIITTNYDQILEANQPNRTIDVFENTNSFLTRKSLQNDSEFLYKIHGDFKNPENIILFKSDYETIYAQQTSNSDALGDFFKNKTFLFLGFSLSDPFINDLFTNIKSLYNNYTVGNHYIFSTTNNNDFSRFDVKNIKVDNWTESLENYLKILIEEKESFNMTLVEKDIVTIEEESIDSLFLLIKSKTEDLKKDPGNRILAAEMHDLKSKIDQLIYGDLDYLKTFDKEYKNNHLQMLFQTIYGNEKLNQETINEINRIRTDYEHHKWFERSQLVSALTCSLFIFNKADEKKISLLVDFINDNEDKTWQRAITYLIMILNHLGNKWLRFEPIKKKIKSLTLNAQIQNACQEIIEYILIFGITRYNFTEKVFENPYFNENPYNYFLPFFKENNPLFENVYDNYDGENIEKFIELLDKFPYPDSFKYIMCNTKSKNNELKSNDDEDLEIMKKHLNINSFYFPFAGYIQEFVSFINGFPPLQNKKLIDKQLKITSTPLKDYLLSEKERFRALGFHFYKDENWGQAIVNFEKYVCFQSDDLMVMDKLANCYFKNNNKLKAKEVSISILEIFPKQKYNLLRLANIYSDENNYEMVLEMFDKYISIDPDEPSISFRKALILVDLKRYDDALISIQQVNQSFKDEADLYSVYGIIYRGLKRYSQALEFFDKAISLDDKKAKYYYEKAELYQVMKEYEKAIEFIDKALLIEPSDHYYYIKFYYFLYSNKVEESYVILLKVKDRGEEYANALANYYRLNGEYDLALSTIEKLIETSSDKRFIGTKAAIYSSMEDHDSFYKLLEEVLIAGVDVNMFLPDVKSKYRKEDKFIKTLEKYNQSL